MAGIKYKAQIDMAVKPSDKTHVVRLADIEPFYYDGLLTPLPGGVTNDVALDDIEDIDGKPINESQIFFGKTVIADLKGAMGIVYEFTDAPDNEALGVMTITSNAVLEYELS